MDAKCIKCENKAYFDLERDMIICKRCNIEIEYDRYIDIMKEKALNLADDFQMDFDKSGF